MLNFSFFVIFDWVPKDRIQKYLKLPERYGEATKEGSFFNGHSEGKRVKGRPFPPLKLEWGGGKGLSGTVIKKKHFFSAS